MAKTGPQKIPGASLTYFYGTGQFSGSDMEVNCGVAHTTEGRTVPSYADASGRRGANAPTVTGLPDCAARRIRWHQHYDVDESARVGTCDPKARDAWVRAGHRQNVDFIFWPEAPEWALAEVAWLVRWLHEQHGVPLTCVRDWLAYGADARRPGVVPASYGASPARMSFAEWQAFKGWCGHQHVPENDHGDPGSMDFARVIQLAKGEVKEEEMPLTTDDVKKVWTTDNIIGVPADWSPGNDAWTAASLLIDSGKRLRSLQADLKALTAVNGELVKAVGTLAANVGDLDPAAIVAELRASIESVTIHLDADGA
jgi:hypothetical protein